MSQIYNYIPIDLILRVHNYSIKTEVKRFINVRFRTESFKEHIALQRIERTPELDHVVNSNLSVKTYQKNLSWKIANTFNRFRPKKFLK